jgi:hypothetical protein
MTADLHIAGLQTAKSGVRCIAAGHERQVSIGQRPIRDIPKAAMTAAKLPSATEALTLAFSPDSPYQPSNRSDGGFAVPVLQQPDTVRKVVVSEIFTTSWIRDPR